MAARLLQDRARERRSRDPRATGLALHK
jgi:hypothetical protein